MLSLSLNSSAARFPRGTAVKHGDGLTVCDILSLIFSSMRTSGCNPVGRLTNAVASGSSHLTTLWNTVGALSTSQSCLSLQCAEARGDEHISSPRPVSSKNFSILGFSSLTLRYWDASSAQRVIVEEAYHPQGHSSNVLTQIREMRVMDGVQHTLKTSTSAQVLLLPLYFRIFRSYCHFYDVPDGCWRRCSFACFAEAWRYGHVKICNWKTHVSIAVFKYLSTRACCSMSVLMFLILCGLFIFIIPRFRSLYHTTHNRQRLAILSNWASYAAAEAEDTSSTATARKEEYGSSSAPPKHRQLGMMMARCRINCQNRQKGFPREKKITRALLVVIPEVGKICMTEQYFHLNICYMFWY
jgi:hypothetical protein